MESLIPAALLGAFAALTLSASAKEPPARGGTYVLENGYIQLSGAGGSFTRFEIDPAGNGHYGHNWIRSLRLGDKALDAGPAFRWKLADRTLHLRDVPVAAVQSRDLGKKSHAYPLWPGKRLGQRFRVDWESFVRVSGNFPTWCDSHSGFTLTLRRGAPDGEIIARNTFKDSPDDAEQSLEFEPQPPGAYYLEMSDPVGTPGWWFADGAASDEETAFATGLVGDEPIPFTFCMRAYGYNPRRADWEIRLDGNRVHWAVSGTEPAPVQLVTTWIRDGYVTDDPKKIVFRHFLGDNGIYRPVHQFKRRASESLAVSQWVEMASTRGFNLRFLFPGGGKLDWRMDADSMIFPLDPKSMTLEALPYSDQLPDTFPAFFSSDPKLDKELSQFLCSHGFNFGAGCFPDWKEWQSRILAWTKNPQKDQEAAYLKSGYPIRADGYVNTWGDSEGWPFPFKDDNKDGKNDYDTRHFTTNAGFILGSARHAMWNRDRAFLEAVLPRARAAMEYQLGPLRGAKGVIVTNADGHSGKNGGIGSNYWDILPFGHKDAFSNSYYYASLDAMAELEQLAVAQGLPAGPHPPEYYRELRKTVRADYQNTFWDDAAGRFAGCVDVDGARHDYGFTFVNMEAAAYGLADPEQVRRIYRWMEKDPTASGKRDTYSRWVFAPRACTEFNPPSGIFNSPASFPPVRRPAWWFFGWRGTNYDDQCQSGGAILYTSYYDIMARTQFLGADNGFKRFKAILARYAEADHLSGGSPLCRGETSQGHGIPGSAGVESEFPESGLVPVSFLYAFLGIEADAEGLKVRPNLPTALEFAGVRNLSYGGKTYELRVTRDAVAVRCTDSGSDFSIERPVVPGEAFCLDKFLPR